MRREAALLLGLGLAAAGTPAQEPVAYRVVGHREDAEESQRIRQVEREHPPLI